MNSSLSDGHRFAVDIGIVMLMVSCRLRTCNGWACSSAREMETTGDSGISESILGAWLKVDPIAKIEGSALSLKYCDKA